MKASNWGWSLRDIDETDIESLLPFFYKIAGGGGKLPSQRIYADDPRAAWLGVPE